MNPPKNADASETDFEDAILRVEKSLEPEQSTPRRYLP